MSKIKNKKILIVYYSFSGQTNNLLRGLEQKLTCRGIEVVRIRLIPSKPLRFPVNGILPCLWLMLTTFLRRRVPIQNIKFKESEKFDLIILAGPTWSYNPSGPILSLIDRYGPKLFNSNLVLPLISCRGYWSIHCFGLRRMLERCGAMVPNCIVFSHPNPEPWRTIGVFLKIAGKNPERHAFLGKKYQKFGHSREQQKEAEHFGELIADALISESPLKEINFRTSKALP